jgi:hypothetical protein
MDAITLSLNRQKLMEKALPGHPTRAEIWLIKCSYKGEPDTRQDT